MKLSNKVLTVFTAAEQRIDIYNSWLGTETIYYNGEMVSKKNSIFGEQHHFAITTKNETKHYLVNIAYRWPMRIGFDVFENGKAIVLS
jgi:hypothetical protein